MSYFSSSPWNKEIVTGVTIPLFMRERQNFLVYFPEYIIHKKFQG